MSSSRRSHALANNASARGERQTFPVQTKTTRMVRGLSAAVRTRSRRRPRAEQRLRPPRRAHDGIDERAEGRGERQLDPTEISDPEPCLERHGESGKTGGGRLSNAPVVAGELLLLQTDSGDVQAWRSQARATG